MIKNLVLLICCISLMNCKAVSKEGKENLVTQPIVFTLNPGINVQTIHGFGASDAWACQFVGANWTDEKKNQIADWLFSEEKDEHGNPRGIGLSIWRFNIGGGSAEQGTASEIRDPWRRSECFLTEPGQYNWKKQAGQRWFLQAAKSRGVEYFIAFVNSPPVHLTKNGKAYSSSPDHYNLGEENYSAYVDFLGNVLEHFNDQEGIEFDYISPFNEPQWDWMKPSQEGTPAQNSEIAAVTRLLNTKLEAEGINTKIEIPETAQIEYLYESANKEGRGNQVEAFFSPTSESYLGNLSHIARKLAGHSYFSTWDFKHMNDVRQKLVEKINTVDPSLEYWMTEYCLFEDNDQIRGNRRDLGMTPAMYLARVIHADLTVANASSWQWWTAVSAYDYKDGLVYISKNKNDGEIFDSKMLWVLGNYSRFIRPGMKRIAVESQEENDLDFSAYKSHDSRQLVFVINNYNAIAVDFQLVFDSSEEYQLEAYLTSGNAADDLRLVRSGRLDEKLSIPGKSVMTVVFQKSSL